MYKKIGFAVVITLAFNTTAFAALDTLKEKCATVSKLAEDTMTLRQHGSPISVPLEISQKFSDDGTSSGITTTELMDSVIIDAYSQDLRYSERMKQVSINEFATKYYLVCMQNN